MSSGSSPVTARLSVGVRAVIGLFAAITALIVAVAAARIIQSPATISEELTPGGQVWLLLPPLVIVFAGGIGSSIRALLGQDALAKRNRETGVPTFSIRRLASELPAFWFFAASFLLTTWGRAFFAIFSSPGRPQSLTAVVFGLTSLLGAAFSAVWMAGIALGLKRRR
ncbi:hypothetical protein [Sinomonas sp. RB5]